jgi:hypothetical protein
MPPPRRAPKPVNPAQIRGAIQGGQKGDKLAGFDPAMAPLETDSEAGGAPLSEGQPEQHRMGQADRNSTSHGDAMRQFPGEGGEKGGVGPAIFLAIAALFILLAISVVVMLIP